MKNTTTAETRAVAILANGLLVMLKKTTREGLPIYEDSKASTALKTLRLELSGWGLPGD